MKLWNEYAIEPDIFANYHLGSEILSGVGIDQGRIVGALPKAWADRVRRVGGQHNRPAQQLKLIERLNALRDAIIPRNLDYDGTRPWRDQVFEAHAQIPFHALLLNGPVAKSAVIDASLGLAGEPLWQNTRSIEIPRAASNLALALSPLLVRAREVALVDAYFNPSIQLRNSKWLRPLQAIASSLPTDGRLSRFEVHALNPRNPRDKWRPGLFTAHCNQNLCAAIPGGMRIKAILWQERDGGVEFHERLIVTDVGGVSIDPGIDDGPAGEVYKLRLLGHGEILAYFSKFTPISAPYDLIEQDEVTGR
jgi:hypothetical protein